MNSQEWASFVDHVMIVDRMSISGRDPETVVRSCILALNIASWDRTLAYVCYHIASSLGDFPFTWKQVKSALHHEAEVTRARKLRDDILKYWGYAIPIWRAGSDCFDVKETCLSLLMGNDFLPPSGLKERKI
jgi:hypothetical protein